MTASLHEAIFTEELFLIPPKVTVVIDRPWSKVIQEERILLEKILGALKLSTDKVRILNLELTSDFNFDTSEKIIAFGKPYSGGPFYEVIALGTIPMVTSESLDKLITNDEAKKQLWQALKRLFSAS
jgi:DNA polymerase III psi subunit.